MVSPLLSVVTLTYNHEPYIAQCIEGVLAQKTSFPIEYIIADDCSTDGTRAICEEYAKNNPDIIRLISSSANVGAVENEQRAFLAAKGKYIATCEGDDYWTDPLKLQKQVDFLESHPEYSVCFHRFKKYHEIDGSWEGDSCGNLFEDSVCQGVEINMHQFMHQWVTQYLTMVFRKDCYAFDAYRRYQYFRDTHQIYHLMKNGRCWLFSFIGGVYRMTGSGEYTLKDKFHQEEMTLAVDHELWKVNNDIGWKEMCGIVMQYCIDSFYKDSQYKKRLLLYLIKIQAHHIGFKRTIKNLWKIIR